jgi:HSP20 family protein
MDFKKLAPWNWFKKEEEAEGTVPVRRADSPSKHNDNTYENPVVNFHREVDRLFENTFRDLGLSALRNDLVSPLGTAGFLKPRVDVGASEKNYTITVEIPGVSEKDIRLEISNNTMTIKGEKKQEKEEKEKNYYRIERSYGSFQRVLSLPDDANQDEITAAFKNGVLTINMPKRTLPGREAKQIEIKSIS